MIWIFRASLICALLLSAAGASYSQTKEEMEKWNQPIAPFRIIGNVCYVGASDITSFLIVTPEGDIVLDGGLSETAPQIEANLRSLGFKLSDVKVLLNSHAHFDHAGGLAELKKSTGAKLVAMAGDVSPLERGGGTAISFLATQLCSRRSSPIVSFTTAIRSAWGERRSRPI